MGLFATSEFSLHPSPFPPAGPETSFRFFRDQRRASRNPTGTTAKKTGIQTGALQGFPWAFLLLQNSAFILPLFLPPAQKRHSGFFATKDAHQGIQPEQPRKRPESRQERCKDSHGPFCYFRIQPSSFPFSSRRPRNVIPVFSRPKTRIKESNRNNREKDRNPG
ncbi:MAG: hypothetical protein BWY09_01617 [Candidatus Hydrogenedentes bacterium ADurb.Bin179]|nr:MAG: hypothetical protein BWY09_01617 [Candidatus Hydrogenedentes bacterium ADurb.Bin179]